MTEAYHTKYRPTSFETVKGQDAQCAALKRSLDKKTSQVFLLSGPSGCGKTTLARIAAAHVGCDPRDVIEVDAATYSGADETRKLQDVMSYRPITGGEHRAVILDECHGLSSKAWETLLKTIEEPTRHSFWFFCTTNPGKVPHTIKTRCVGLTLNSLELDQIAQVVDRVIKREKLQVSEGARKVIIREARGSARQALVNLGVASDAKTSKEAARLLHTEIESDPLREFCQFLMRPGSWVAAMALVKRFGETPNYEGLRIVVFNYMGKVLQGAKNDDAAIAALRVLEHWSTPFNSAEGAGPFMLALGRTMFEPE